MLAIWKAHINPRAEGSTSALSQGLSRYCPEPCRVGSLTKASSRPKSAGISLLTGHVPRVSPQKPGVSHKTSTPWCLLLSILWETAWSLTYSSSEGEQAACTSKVPDIIEQGHNKGMERQPRLQGICGRGEVDKEILPKLTAKYMHFLTYSLSHICLLSRSQIFSEQLSALCCFNHSFFGDSKAVSKSCQCN